MRTKLTIFVLALLAFAGCVPEVEEMEGIVLNLVVAKPDTRATKPGEEALNENKLPDRVDVFFYNETTGEITKECLNQILRNGSQVRILTSVNDIEDIFGTTSSGAHCGVFIVTNFTGTYEGTANARTIDEIKSSLIQDPVWETQEGTRWNYIQSAFVMTGEQQLTLGNAQGSQPINQTVALERVAAKVTFAVTVADNATGESGQWTPDKKNMDVYMVYPMRKATLGAEPVQMPATASETYGTNGSNGTIVYAQYHNMKLCATGDSTLRNRVVAGDTVPTRVPVYTTIDSVAPHIGQIKPFYTYPMKWETGSFMEPYMKLIIPWTYGNTTKNYYYKIPFHGNEMLRNHWYHISIDVQILGTEQADPPEVIIHYSIAPWGGTMDDSTAEDITSVTSVPATVITARYLNVPTTEYVMYNDSIITIPIQSSHDVEVVGFTVASGAYTATHDIPANYVGVNPSIYNPFSTTLSNQIVAARPDYSSSTPSAVTSSFTYNQAPNAKGWSVTVNGRESVTLKHAMNQDMSSSDYDVAPYTVRMRFRHEGEGASLYFTDVIVEQRPSIIIKPELNSGGTSNYGYGYVNGAQNNGTNWTRTGSYNNYRYSSTDGSWTGRYYYDNYGNIQAYDVWTYYLGTAPNDLSNSSNTNENMYIIETSVLPTSGAVANYMLGDPRSREIDNLGQDWSQTKPAVKGSDRQISYYYPAGGAEYSNFIAPKFRIASSFGSTQPVTFDNAKRRCASYQEDGYPAGRWRLPTAAEITYMAQLTTDGLIPRLLGGSTGSGTTDYWSNNGYVTVADGTNTASPVTNTGGTGNKYIRCVYDEWYWEDTAYEKVDKTAFRWGDQPRSEVRKN